MFLQPSLRRSSSVSAALLAVFLIASAPRTAAASGAPDAHSVLILSTTINGGISSPEALQAGLLGLTPVIVDPMTWGGMTTAEFASYRALVLGDPRCVGSPTPLAPAVANRGVWGPAVTGNVVINVTDPVFHDGQGGAQLTRASIAFAADAPATGAYISLSCYYFTVPQAAPVDPPVLSPFGSFAVFGQLGLCPQHSHIVAVHPALAGLTDGNLSNWSCSTHGGFVAWPAAFSVLAISLDLPPSFVASDGTTGLPYILARSETLAPIGCGDGVVLGDEECDDGNLEDGDGCSSTCRIPPNLPPEALCQDVTVSMPEDACAAAASVDDGSFDPDGDPIVLEQTPPGPYGLGETLVTLTVTDDSGAASTCQATVTAVDDTAPFIECGAPPSIIPPDAPISFAATASDNCGIASVEISAFDCFAINGAGKRVDKTGSCVVASEGATLTVADSGGVGDHITWIVTATDTSGNPLIRHCEVVVDNPGRGLGGP